jgi:hypothetical protein
MLTFIKCFKVLAVTMISFVFIILFAVACSDQPGSGGGGGSDPIVIPDNPPAVDGGGFANENVYRDYPNRMVTPNNLNDFVELVLAAMSRDTHNRSSRSLPEEYESGTWREKGSYTRIGNVSGRVEIASEYEGSYRWTPKTETEKWYESMALRFFDFSNTDSLFFGGNLGVLEATGNQHSGDIRHYEDKFSGVIEFRGKYSGRVVFDNLTRVFKERHICGYYPNGDCLRDTLEDRITRGRFYVESNGNQINLPVNLLETFAWPESDERDFGNTPTINRVMPSVPSAPSGRLSSRSGETVNSSNLTSFFSAYRSELHDSYYDSRGYEGGGTWEERSHGREYGYFEFKESEVFKRNNSGSFYSGTGTTEYFDYSNTGSLYFGGGYGLANTYESGNNSNGWWSRRENKYNGRINFNGDFRGTLEFRNFHYREEQGNSINWDDRYRHLDGSVIIGSLDVTDEYMKWIVKREWISVPANVNDTYTGWLDLEGGWSFNNASATITGGNSITISGDGFNTFNGTISDLSGNSTYQYGIITINGNSGEFHFWDSGYKSIQISIDGWGWFSGEVW